MTKPKVKSELPTPDTLIKGAYREEEIDANRAGSPKRLRRLDGDELDRLLLAGRMTQDEHATLNRFRRELYKAGLVWCPRAGFVAGDSSGGGHYVADRKFALAKMVGTQMDAVTGALGPKDRDSLIGVLTMDMRLPKGLEPILSKGAAALDKIYKRD